MFCIKCGLEKELAKRCRKCAQVYHKKYSQEHSNKLNNRSKEYYLNNKEKVQEYQQKNKSKIRLYNNDYERNRKVIDPAFKLRRNCSRLVNHALCGSKNGQSILKYLPYTMQELRQHLENQFDNKMSWENYGIYWHIDHIHPQSLLLYTSMMDDNFKKCWALENLRPLEAIENMKKSNKLVKQ